MRIPTELRREMLAHLQACLPEEGCGFLGGLPGEARRVYGIENELHSPVRFRMRAEAQLQAFLRMEAEGLDLVAIFHSHPGGPALPSTTDIAEFAYPEAVTLIWSPVEGDWKMGAFWIARGQVAPAAIEE